MGPYIIIKWAPNNNIAPGGQGSFNLMLPTNLNV